MIIVVSCECHVLLVDAVLLVAHEIEVACEDHRLVVLPLDVVLDVLVELYPVVLVSAPECA